MRMRKGLPSTTSLVTLVTTGGSTGTMTVERTDAASFAEFVSTAVEVTVAVASTFEP